MSGILQINAVYGVGSTGRNCEELAEGLERRGIQVHNAYAKEPRSAPRNGLTIGSAYDQKAHALLSRISGLQGYFSRGATSSLLRHIDAIRPDVVHLHNLHANYVHLDLLFDYLACRAVPTAITLHDCWMYTGKCTHYTVAGCDRWQRDCGNCPALASDNKSWFFDQTPKMIKDKRLWVGRVPRLGVIGVSEWIANEARRSLLSTAQIIRTIHNWVDTETFKPLGRSRAMSERLGMQQSDFVVLAVASSWSEKKGLSKFLRMSSLLPTGVRLLLIGKVANDCAIPSNVVHIDATNDTRELAEYYSFADVFVNFSLEETFGKVTAEALSCGTPVVVMNSTASPELVGENCGFVVDSCTAEEALNRIQDVQRQGKQSFSTHCRRFALATFALERAIDSHIAFYQDLAQKSFTDAAA